MQHKNPIYTLKQLKALPDQKNITVWPGFLELYTQSPRVDLHKSGLNPKDGIFYKSLFLEDQLQGFIGCMIVEQKKNGTNTATIYCAPAYNDGDGRMRLPYTLTVGDKKIENFYVEGSAFGRQRNGTTHVNFIKLLHQHGIIPYNEKHIKDGFMFGFGLFPTIDGFIFVNRSANFQIPTIEYDPLYKAIHGVSISDFERYIPKDISEMIVLSLAHALAINPDNIIRACSNYAKDEAFISISDKEKYQLLMQSFILCFQLKKEGKVDARNLQEIIKFLPPKKIMTDQWLSSLYESLYPQPSNMKDLVPLLSKAGVDIQQLIYLMDKDDTHDQSEKSSLREILQHYLKKHSAVVKDAQPTAKEVLARYIKHIEEYPWDVQDEKSKTIHFEKDQSRKVPFVIAELYNYIRVMINSGNMDTIKLSAFIKENLKNNSSMISFASHRRTLEVSKFLDHVEKFEKCTESVTSAPKPLAPL